MGKVINVGTIGHVAHSKVRFVNPMLECDNPEAMLSGIAPRHEVTREMLEAAGYRISIVDERVKVDLITFTELYEEPKPHRWPRYC